jgi:hypothetical protein
VTDHRKLICERIRALNGQIAHDQQIIEYLTGRNKLYQAEVDQLGELLKDLDELHMHRCFQRSAADKAIDNFNEIKKVEFTNGSSYVIGVDRARGGGSLWVIGEGKTDD